MPEAKVPCESCPWVAKGKRPVRVSDADKARAADSCWFACREDGGTCYGAVRFTQSADAETIRAAARGQGPDTPDHTPARITPPTTTVDVVSTASKED